MADSKKGKPAPKANPKEPKYQIVCPPLPDYSETAVVCNSMFGSLMALEKSHFAAKQKLASNWWTIVKTWYPKMHDQVYCVPPYHFNTVSYKPRFDKQAVPTAPCHKYGYYEYLPVQYSKIKDDEAQQRIIYTMSAFLRNRKSTAFILSNMEFQNYLNKDYLVQAGSRLVNYYRPNLQKGEEGDVDVLIIDKKEGIFLLEVKAIGDRVDVRTVSEEDKLKELSKKFEVVTKQVEKQRDIVKRLVNVLDTNGLIKVRSGIVLANTKRDLFEQALDAFPKKADDLRKAMHVSDNEQLSRSTFCADDLPPCFKVKGSDEMDPALFPRLEKVWEALKEIDGTSEPMDNRTYEHIVALFCGPLTTVKIYTEKSMPRVRLVRETTKKKFNKPDKVVFDECRDESGAARETARRFSELVLQPAQLEILNRNEDFVHLEGPPGTGKTLMLLLRVLTWLDNGNKVWLMSFFPPSRSVTHVLFQQTRRMIDMYYSHSISDAEQRKKNLDIFILARPKETLDENYFWRRLDKCRDRAKFKVKHNKKNNQSNIASPFDKKVCIVVDESGMTGEGLHNFFRQVALCHRRKEFHNEKFAGGLSVWSASVERIGRPCYVKKPENQEADTRLQFGTLWKLKMPLRCPPTVQRALMLVQPSLNRKEICFFKEKDIVANPTYPVEEGEVQDATQGKTGPYNQYPAQGLEVFLIGHGSHENPEEDIWYCRQCGFKLARHLKHTLKIGQPNTHYVCDDEPLHYKDVMIVATQNAFQFSVPVAGFMYAMKKEKLKVAVNTTREEGSTAVTDNDTILIMDMTSVHGLERAIIIVVPEVKPPPELPAQYKTQFAYGISGPADPLKEVLEETKGKDFTISGDGQLHEEDDGASIASDNTSCAGDAPEDMETEDQCPAAAGSSDGGCPRVKSGEECMDVDEPPDPVTERDYDDLKYTETDSEGEEGETPDPNVPPGVKKLEDKLTFANSYSEEHIKKALESLSPQSRKDIFYIGSRAVCQMILIHRADDLPERDPPTSETEMSETEPPGREPQDAEGLKQQ